MPFCCNDKEDASLTFKPICMQVDACGGADVFISNAKPEISWRFLCDDPFFRQSAYRIVATKENGEILWDTNKVASTECRWIPWNGPTLKSRDSFTLTVQAFDQNGRPSEWSSPVHVEVSLLDNHDWGDAHWIWHDRNNYSTTAPSPYFRKPFNVHGKLAKARLYITAHGVFEAYIDGVAVSPDLLAPGWVDFRQEIPFMGYDVTERLNVGEHVLGAIVADGWCCGNLTTFRKRNVYHEHPDLLARLELLYSDGRHDAIVTDASWRTSTGQILSSDLYDGEFVDARLEPPDWQSSGFDDSRWLAAADGGPIFPSIPLVPKTSPPVRVVKELEPVRILNSKKDTYIWDFGQNFTGVFRARFKGQKGRLFRFKVAEMLDDDGTLYTLNYRCARCEDSYVCIDGINEFTPKFTFHGFRYLQIDGFQFLDYPPDNVEVIGLVMQSDMPEISSFTCGNQLVNRLWLNALWGQKGNFLELPTDCPQRDERLGWTGDAQVFAPTAMMNMDCCAFYRKYLRDVREGFAESGAAPSMAPAVLRIHDGAAAWGDAIILIPHALYRHYGWKEILRENYDAMKRSIEYQKSVSDGFIVRTGQFGDWLAPDKTDVSFVATAYFAHCSECLAEIACALGNKEDFIHFSRLAKDIRVAFRKEYFDNDGHCKLHTQTALLMMLAFKLNEKDETARLAAELKAAIRNNGNHLSTGFIGTSMILNTLADHGMADVACDLLLQEEHPSWLYMVKQGATTMWESWNSYTREKGFGKVSMNSFNHYAYGTVASFLICYIGGIHYSKDGLFLKIIPDARLSPVNAVFDSPYGRIESHWSFSDAGVLSWNVLVPPGLEATAELPSGKTCSLPAESSSLLP